MWWRRKQQDFKAEIEAHLQLEADQLRADGVTPDDAQFAARRAFGNRTSAEERFYESNRWILFDHILRDIRFAARVLAKDIRFSALAILGLALGIGISTTIFTLLGAAAVLGAEAVQDGASYVTLSNLVNGRESNLSYADFQYYRDRATAFRSVDCYSSRQRLVLGPLTVGDVRTDAQDIDARFVSANFLTSPGLAPAIGRSFSEQEERTGGPVAVLNFMFWKNRLAGDPGILGKSVILNAHPVTVIGIADARYGPGDRTGFYVPVELQPALLLREDWLHDLQMNWLNVGARLRPGVTARQAQTEIDVLSDALRQSRLTNLAGVRAVVSAYGLRDPKKRQGFLTAALAVMAAVSMILLIACSNLANLLLARAVVRRREIGVRLSLGASRTRLISQLLTESLLLAAVGGALGILFSHWLSRFLVVLTNPVLRWQGLDLHSDYRVILYGLGLSLAAGFSFGLAPAVAATRTNLSRALHAEGLDETSHSQTRRIWSPRNVLVIVPLAVSLLLLIAAALTVRYVQHIYLRAPALDTARLLGMQFNLHLQGYGEARTRQFQDTLRQRVSMIPGVASVALAGGTRLPFVTTYQMGTAPLITDGSTGPSSLVAYNIVSAAYFNTVGARVTRGRVFTEADREGAPWVAIVSQSLVRTLWRDQEPIGRRIRLAKSGSFFEVIGVAADLPDATETDPVKSVFPVVYVPYGQGKLFLGATQIEEPVEQMQFLIRTTGEPAKLKTVLRQEVLAIDPSLRVTIQTLEEAIASYVQPMRTISLLLSVLGGLALIMASGGIYAILAYSVSQRTREIGIRIALGAQHREILALAMRRTAVLIGWGIGLGLAGALGLSRIMSSQLADLGGVDAATCASAALPLAVIAAFASYVPARKALHVDPVQALRCD
jgi:predicted permease